MQPFRFLQSYNRKSWWAWSRRILTSSTTCCVGNSGNHQPVLNLTAGVSKLLLLHACASSLWLSVFPLWQPCDREQRVGRPSGHGGIAGLRGGLQREFVSTGAAFTTIPARWQQQREQPDQRGFPQRSQTKSEQEATGKQIWYSSWVWVSYLISM